MAEAVLDASAILAYLLDEPGADVVAPALATGLVSANNIAEVCNVLMGRNLNSHEVRRAIDGLDLRIAPVDAELAFEIGIMIRQFRRFGLSLGDCSCLGLARALRLPALTGDRVWAEIDGVGVEVRLFR